MSDHESSALARNWPVGTELTQPQDFRHYRHYYLRVNTQAATRLTMATFLAGLTFATFAALISTAQVDAAHLNLQQSAAAILLGVGAIAFLLATVSTYAALQRVNDVSPSTLDLFKTATPASFAFDDGERLRYAYNAYSESSAFIPCGLLLLLISMPFIGFHLRSPIGPIVLIALILGTILLRTSWRITFDVGQRQRQAAKMGFIRAESPAGDVAST